MIHGRKPIKVAYTNLSRQEMYKNQICYQLENMCFNHKFHFVLICHTEKWILSNLFVKKRKRKKEGFNYTVRNYVSDKGLCIK